jgi:predicted Zn-dependent peptidase
VIELVCRELRRLRSSGVGKKELDRTKNQMKGSLMLSLESSHSRMSKLAKDELYLGHHTSLADMLVEIDRVSEEQVHRLSCELFDPDSLSITALGPISRNAIQPSLL